MSKVKRTDKSIAKLKEQIKGATRVGDKLILYIELIDILLYADPLKAKKVLSKLKVILQKQPSPSIRLSFSLREALHLYLNGDFNGSESLYKRCIEKLNPEHDGSQLAEIILDFIGISVDQNRPVISQGYLSVAKDLIVTSGSKKLRYRWYCRRGQVAILMGDWKKAMKYLQKADQLLRNNKVLSIKDHYYNGIIHYSVGQLQIDRGMQKTSRSYFKKALEILNKSSVAVLKARIYLQIGLQYIEKNQIDKGIRILKEGLESDDFTDIESNIRIASNLGYCYYQKNELGKALNYFNKSEQLIFDFESRFQLLLTKIWLWKGNIFELKEKRKKAIRQFEEAYLLSLENDFKEEQLVIAQKLSSNYIALGEKSSAIQFLKEEIALLTEVETMRTDRKIKAMAENHQQEMESKDKQIEVLEAARLQLKALRAQMNPHFIFNALNSIQHFISVNKKDAALKYLARFAKLIRQTLEFSEEEMITIEKEVKFLSDYLNIEKLRFEERLNYEIIVDKKLDLTTSFIPSMIIQPYIENAVEHGIRTVENGLIRVELIKEKSNRIICIVEDNGVGRTKSKNQKDEIYSIAHKSKGTSITKDRLILLEKSTNQHASVEVIDLKDELNGGPLGTRIKIFLPIFDEKS